MEIFLDKNGCTVRVAFEQNAFSKGSGHVLVICDYEGKWLLTSHKERGWEFPGGKIEAGETPEAAAKREVFEETGGMLESCIHLGEYEVSNGSNCFVKSIFFGRVNKLVKNGFYFETNGPVFEEGNILETRFNPKYSFIMQDDVVQKSIEYINKIGLNERVHVFNK